MSLRDHTAVWLDRYHRARRHQPSLRARIRELEAEVQESRQLNRRIAELTDVVVELLLPLHQQDPALAEQVLAAYRARI